jgi:hypothetical protein
MAIPACFKPVTLDWPHHAVMKVIDGFAVWVSLPGRPLLVSHRIWGVPMGSKEKASSSERGDWRLGAERWGWGGQKNQIQAPKVSAYSRRAA